MRNKQVRYMEYIMLVFNIVVVMGITLFIALTTNRICRLYTGSEFLGQVKAIPWNPGLLCYIIAGLLLMLVLSYLVREKWLYDYIGYQYISLFIDLVISLTIVYLLGFNYNGILLWVFANVIFRIEGIKGKYALVALSILSYIGTDHGLAMVNRNMYSIEDYIGYYDATVQRYLLGSYTAILSLNIILFLILCVYIILVQSGTITQVEQLYHKLSEANQDLMKANTKLQEYADIKEKMGETKERNRLAREIHDTLGHTLTGISAGLDACLATIDRAPESTKKQMEVLSQITRDGILEVRRSVKKLRPDALARLSLERAIYKMISRFNSMESTKIHFTCSVDNLKFDEDEENAIYRVVQESITNSVRHGQAENIYLNIDRQYEDLYILIRDDGVGVKEIKKGFGTRHIIERVENLRGTVEFDGSDGFTTRVVIPIRWGKTYD